MEWIEAYATGVARIDEQHKMLFQLGEDFRLALGEGRGERVYENLLDSLALYAQAHFGAEERCMAACRCAAAARNATAHARFIEMVTGYRERYDRAGYREGDAGELVDFLEQWLAGHIAGIDVELRDYAHALPPDWATAPG